MAGDYKHLKCSKYVICRIYYNGIVLPGVAARSESQGTGDIWNLFPPTGPHVYGHDLHQQGPATHDRLRCSVQQEQVSVELPSSEISLKIPPSLLAPWS